MESTLKRVMGGRASLMQQLPQDNSDELHYSIIAKYRELKEMLNPMGSDVLLELLEKKSTRQNRILVRFKDKILPVSFNEIALIYLENDLLRLMTFEGKIYFIQKSLEELEVQLGSTFYRVNRQYLVSKAAIKDLNTNMTRAISVNLTVVFPATITVSKLKSGHFLDWLTF